MSSSQKICGGEGKDENTMVLISVAECVSCAVSEGGAEDAERAEGVFGSAGERRATGSGSRRKSH